MNVFRTLAAISAVLALAVSTAGSWDHEHVDASSSSAHCSVDHQQDDEVSRRTGIVRAGDAHEHHCLACRTGQRRGAFAAPASSRLAALVVGDLRVPATPPHAIVGERSSPPPRGPPRA